MWMRLERVVAAVEEDGPAVDPTEVVEEDEEVGEDSSEEAEEVLL